MKVQQTSTLGKLDRLSDIAMREEGGTGIGSLSCEEFVADKEVCRRIERLD